MAPIIDHAFAFLDLDQDGHRTNRERNRALSPVADHLATAVLFSAASSSDAPAADTVRSFLDYLPDNAASLLAADLVTDIVALGGPRISYRICVCVDQSLLNPSFTREMASFSPQDRGCSHPLP